MHLKKNTIWILAGLLATLTLSACDNMRDGNRFKPYEETPFFEDGSVARQPIEGTVPQGFLRADKHLYEGKTSEGTFESEFPFPVTEAVLARGQDRYNIYCMVCHGVTGAGDGMVVRRGYKVPTAYQDERLKNMPVGYFYNVMTEGFGVMSSYKAELTPEDRWAVAAYIRALQRIDSASAAVSNGSAVTPQPHQAQPTETGMA